MHLRRIELRNFRAYQTAELDFEPKGLSVVIGPNNSGKSALLSALDMVGGQPVEGQLPFAGSAASPEIRAFFAFDADERQQLTETVAPQFQDEAKAATDGAVYTFSDVRDGLPRLGVIQIAVVRSDGHQWPIADLALHPVAPGYGTIQTVDWSNWLHDWPDKLELRQGVQLGGNVTRDLERGDPGSLPAMLAIWRLGFYHFRSLRPGTSGRTTSTEHHPSLQSTGVDLVNYLQWLRGHREDDWGKIRETMRELIPDVGRLQIRAAGNQAEVGFEAQGLGFVNIKDAGTGVEQLLLTITAGQTAAAGMLLHEEPETNLHPGAQRLLMRHIVEWSERRPVVLATHSAVIMDAALRGRVYEVSRAGISSTVRPVRGRTDVADLLSRLGTRFSDILGSERVLIVEGDTDGAILDSWFPELQSHSTVSVVPGGGGAGVWHMQLMEDVTEAADQLPRPVVFLRDRDELTDRDLARLAGLSAVRVLSRRELENYLLNPAAIATVLAERPHVTPAPNPDDVALAIREAADALRDRVVISRVLENADCMSRLTPVSSHERENLFHATDPLAALLTLVHGKLASRLESLEACLREAFDKETAQVARHWEDGWEAIVPGADVLSAVFGPYGGYSKSVDGPKIATAIGRPPDEIANIIRGFLDR
jgi:energy-coupling factor transporter ATP-binding protein EcfA2